ncbi:Hypothetical_protein [Hexamita inflata]|uniref:Hypothetical_protein n=1 Tax=Hexamita inflata TaxID=28002 RepID=A0AA86VF72_9EUKA|nr:Hypothetical protein HINF_LOCUS52623 [Hexamita inflata]
MHPKRLTNHSRRLRISLINGVATIAAIVLTDATMMKPIVPEYGELISRFYAFLKFAFLQFELILNQRKANSCLMHLPKFLVIDGTSAIFGEFKNRKNCQVLSEEFFFRKLN